MSFLARKRQAKKNLPRGRFFLGFFGDSSFSCRLKVKNQAVRENKVLKMAEDSQDELFFCVADPVGDDRILDLNPHTEDEVFNLVHHGRARRRASGAQDTELQRHCLVHPKPGFSCDRSRARKTPSFRRARHGASGTRDTEL